MRCTRLILAVSLFVVAALGGAAELKAADIILSGSVKSSAGDAMGGVMVSAKPEGGTITTTVLTDEAGRYYFPPLAAGKYRVWAQALSFATAKGAIDLSVARSRTSRFGRWRISFTSCPATSCLRRCPRTPSRTSA